VRVLLATFSGLRVLLGTFSGLRDLLTTFSGVRVLLATFSGLRDILVCPALTSCSGDKSVAAIRKSLSNYRRI
jgi:hypothetical protein